MKLVLQIAGGILLALIVATGSMAAYKYLETSRQESREADALHILLKLTPADVRGRCGTPVYQKTTQVADQEWQDLTYLGSSGAVDIELAPDHVVAFRAGNRDVISSAERLQILPCLAGSEASQAAAK
jgi:hypothetical protein